MKICESHFSELVWALTERGLGDFIPETPGEYHRCLRAAASGRTTLQTLDALSYACGYLYSLCHAWERRCEDAGQPKPAASDCPACEITAVDWIAAASAAAWLHAALLGPTILIKPKKKEKNT